MEMWKPVVGYEGKYIVSRKGTIKSLITGKFLKSLSAGKSKYQCVSLWNDGIEKRIGVHRIVAMAFLPNPDKLPEVNHKDENNKNNCVENLEWCSHKYNMVYGTAIDRQSRKRGYEVIGADLDGKIIYGPFWSCSEAGRKTGFNRSSIATSVRRNKPLNGIQWKRIEK